MNRRITFNYTVTLILIDLLLTPLALYLASLARLWLPFSYRLDVRYVYLNPAIYAMVLVIWGVIFPTMSVYDPRRILHLREQMWATFMAVSSSTLVLGGALYLSFRDVPRLLFIYFYLIDLFFLLGSRLLLRTVWAHWSEREQRVSKALIIGAGTLGQDIVRRAREYEWAGLRLEGYVDDDPSKQGSTIEGIPVLGPLDQAPTIIRQRDISEVIFALPLQAYEKLARLISELRELPVRVRMVPDVLNLAFFRATVEDFHGMPLIGLRDPAIDGFDRVVKRLFDLALSSLLLLVLWPLMLLIAVLIRLDSPGPALFRQERVGENGRLFTMYKFRTMFVGAEQHLEELVQETPEGVVFLKRPDDPRVTRLGRFLRRTSLDELPQLFNVIKGEMSLVGPRPELPLLVQHYESWQRQRFAVPPGMTGWWQVSGRSERAMHLHTEDDLYYVRNYSLLLDLRILWRTIGTVLRGRGAF
ncbi:MAG: sugar transferase [Anaerolineae bacterium]|nr:sugar transferase [Anaerolineae bacterium]